MAPLGMIIDSSRQAHRLLRFVLWRTDSRCVVSRRQVYIGKDRVQIGGARY